MGKVKEEFSKVKYQHPEDNGANIWFVQSAYHPIPVWAVNVCDFIEGDEDEDEASS